MPRRPLDIGSFSLAFVVPLLLANANCNNFTPPPNTVKDIFGNFVAGAEQGRRFLKETRVRNG
jgi:hypothetical protein